MTVWLRQQLPYFWAERPDDDLCGDILEIPHNFDPIDALVLVQEIVRAADGDDDKLGTVAVRLLEPLLDLHGTSFVEEFASALSEDTALRQAFRRASLGSIPDDVEQRWRSIGQFKDHSCR